MLNPERVRELLVKALDCYNTLALYRSMRLREVLLMRDAFELDLRDAKKPSTEKFCAMRLLVIDLVLEERQGQEEPPQP